MPDWGGLQTLARAQVCHFTATQAAEYGISLQLLSKRQQSGYLVRPMRGIYRFAAWPTAEREDLIIAWLWSGMRGVISHETALSLHNLGEALPARIQLMLPMLTARVVVPSGYTVYFAQVPADDTMWVGPVLVTTPARTILDIVAVWGDADNLELAIEQGIRRNLFRLREVAEAVAYIGGGRIHRQLKPSSYLGTASATSPDNRQDGP